MSRILVAVLAVAAIAPGAFAASGDDGVTLSLSKGPAAGNVSLQWTGGLTPFSVFRSTSPEDVTTPLSYLGTSSETNWVDTPPVGGVHYYYVQGQCNYNPPELCNGIDDDCDPTTADGSQDPLVGADCDGSDTDLCAEGTRSCGVGGYSCSDATLSTVEECRGDGVDEDCNGQVDEGFITNGNPACTSYTYLGTISGDIGTGSLFYSAYTERWLRVNLAERNSGPANLTVSMSLYSPAGTDFDLYARCLGCAGNTGGWSFNHSMNGHVDATFLRKNDDDRFDDSFAVFIEVRNYASNYCGYWTLYVSGNGGGAYETCGD